MVSYSFCDNKPSPVCALVSTLSMFWSYQQLMKKGICFPVLNSRGIFIALFIAGLPLHKELMPNQREGEKMIQTVLDRNGYGNGKEARLRSNISVRADKTY